MFPNQFRFSFDEKFCFSFEVLLKLKEVKNKQFPANTKKKPASKKQSVRNIIRHIYKEEFKTKN